ncbi:RNA 2',3'-cyclic phosphodiesterase [Candidatus Micrarchaeota archaeon]|nr:RNA 2',3'-cyclic phosphodiesterase [Candidatus Micrarchaeota archaeon]
MARCFVAVKFGGEIEAKLSELQSKAKALGLDATFPRTFHATLVFLGETDEGKIEEAKQKLDSVESGPVAAEVKGAGFFPSEKFVKIFWVGVKGLDKLQHKIAGAFGYNERFEGHVTLARVKTQRNLHLLKQLAKDYERKEFGTATVGEVILFKSALTPQGPRYEELFVKKLS